jgi:TfoX/Sxy family transcriptional regulator of competence genes
MGYNERLAERIRAILADERAISERKMFGGIAFLVDGKMCCGVLGDELVVRVGPARHEDALRKPHTRPMDFTGRPMTGMIYVTTAGVSRGPALRHWVEAGLTAARDAPARRRPRPRRA